jgi:hypothetical protein
VVGEGRGGEREAGGGEDQFLLQHGNLLRLVPVHFTRQRPPSEPIKCNICNIL